jgi:hypothetical protein
MKKFVKWLMMLVCAFVSMYSLAENVTQSMNFQGDVNFDKGAKWMIDGTRVTATAADLNSGVASSSSTLVSNPVLKVYGSNFVVKTGGTLTIPASGLVMPANSMVATVTATCATNANGGTNVWTVTGKDFAGTTVTSPFMFRLYVSTTRDGAPADTLAEVVATSGVLLQEVVADADEWVMATNIVGTAVITATQTPGLTNFVHLVSPMGFRTTYLNEFRVP